MPFFFFFFCHLIGNITIKKDFSNEKKLLLKHTIFVAKRYAMKTFLLPLHQNRGCMRSLATNFQISWLNILETKLVSLEQTIKAMKSLLLDSQQKEYFVTKYTLLVMKKFVAKCLFFRDGYNLCQKHKLHINLCVANMSFSDELFRC